jgi:hypothetical protein
MSQAKPMLQFKKKTVLLSGILILSGLPLLWNMQSLKAQLVTPDDPVPPDSTPKASRGECDRPDTFSHLPEITILQPKERSQATTNQSFPTFLVYLPYDLTANSPGRFVLETSTGELVHEFVDRNSSGNSILAITIPSDPNKALVAGGSYLLSFRVYCNDPTMSNSTGLSARARVQRNANDEVAWYDRLLTAYQTGNQAQWRSLLEAEGLDHIPAALSSDQ